MNEIKFNSIVAWCLSVVITNIYTRADLHTTSQGLPEEKLEKNLICTNKWQRKPHLWRKFHINLKCFMKNQIIYENEKKNIKVLKVFVYRYIQFFSSFHFVYYFFVSKKSITNNKKCSLCGLNIKLKRQNACMCAFVIVVVQLFLFWYYCCSFYSLFQLIALVSASICFYVV